MTIENKIDTSIIGDGKAPNKYLVSISNDYLYFNSKDGILDWIGGLKLFGIKGKSIKIFDTYKGAIKFIKEKLHQGMNHDGIIVNTITIEDRISGLLYCETKHYYSENAQIIECWIVRE